MRIMRVLMAGCFLFVLGVNGVCLGICCEAKGVAARGCPDGGHHDGNCECVCTFDEECADGGYCYGCVGGTCGFKPKGTYCGIACYECDGTGACKEKCSSDVCCEGDGSKLFFEESEKFFDYFSNGIKAIARVQKNLAVI